MASGADVVLRRFSVLLGLGGFIGFGACSVDLVWSLRFRGLRFRGLCCSNSLSHFTFFYQIMFSDYCSRQLCLFPFLREDGVDFENCVYVWCQCGGSSCLKHCFEARWRYVIYPKP